jgi:hypothetical protein
VSRAAARKIADAMRHAAVREHERRGTGRYRGTVLDTSPLRVDLHGTDLELDAGDVTLGKSVVAAGFDVGDVLALIEIDKDEYMAVDVEDTDA